MVTKIKGIGGPDLTESVKVCQSMGYPKRAARLLLEATGEFMEDKERLSRWIETTLVFASRKGKQTRVFRSDDGRTWWLYYSYFTKRDIYNDETRKDLS